MCDIILDTLGTNDYKDIVSFINGLDKRCYKVSPNTSRMEEGERIITTSSHYAYLRVSDGCDNHCTYCLIPSIRGQYRSRTIENIVAEAKKLVEERQKDKVNKLKQNIEDLEEDLVVKKQELDNIYQQNQVMSDKLQEIGIVIGDQPETRSTQTQPVEEKKYQPVEEPVEEKEKTEAYTLLLSVLKTHPIQTYTRNRQRHKQHLTASFHLWS